METRVPTPTIEAYMVAFPPSLILTLSIKATTVKPSTWAIPREVEQRFEDAFTKLFLDRAPFSFPTLIEEERQIIKSIVSRGQAFERLILRW